MEMLTARKGQFYDFGVLTVYGTQAAGFPENTVAAIDMLAQEVGLMIARAAAVNEGMTFAVAGSRSMAAAS